jgi:UDP-N-acetylglucosamine 2-epimerase
VREVDIPALILWPNADAGSDDIARGMRKWRERGLAERMHFFKNLPIATYVRLMKQTACLIGNSSSGIREGAYIGTPVVNLGSRQQNREHGSNVIHAEHNRAAIVAALRKQLNNVSFSSEPIYGCGKAGQAIADILATQPVQVQKRMMF